MNEITKEEFKQILKKADFYYQFAEGQRYYDGKASYNLAVQHSRQNDEFRQMFKQYYDRAFGND